MDFYFILFKFTRVLATTYSDFGKQFNQQLKELVTEIIDVTVDPNGLPLHKFMLVVTYELIAYPPTR